MSGLTNRVAVLGSSCSSTDSSCPPGFLAIVIIECAFLVVGAVLLSRLLEKRIERQVRSGVVRKGWRALQGLGVWSALLYSPFLLAFMLFGALAPGPTELRFASLLLPLAILSLPVGYSRALQRGIRRAGGLPPPPPR